MSCGRTYVMLINTQTLLDTSGQFVAIRPSPSASILTALPVISSIPLSMHLLMLPVWRSGNTLVWINVVAAWMGELPWHKTRLTQPEPSLSG